MSSRRRARTAVHVLAMVSVFALLLGFLPASARLHADPTPPPTSVTIVGNLQDELGCSGDWQPDCAATHLTYDAGDDVWQASFALPAGSHEYKAALNDSWEENYGLHATPGGANIPLSLGGPATVKFYYDHKTHWVTDSQNSVIATVPGNFQSELGCSGDWDPGCLRTWLQDPDGDGIYSFVTRDVPAGNYECKVAINESWAENYGLGGAPGGANIPFTVLANNAQVTFSYNPADHVLTITVAQGQDDHVDWAGLRHDSRDTLYRTPGGAVPAGTPVTLRFRTFHDDVTSVKLRVHDFNANAQQIHDMSLAASDVSCYEDGLEDATCDFWAVTLPNAAPDNLWYRFIVTDGTDTDYYADDTSALDGGLGAASDEAIDNGYALMVHELGFVAPSSAKTSIIYQIFPDRFRNGRASNDPHTGDPRYDDPVLALPWNTLPEGYCRNYADAATGCPWRFDPDPPAWSPTKEAPRGRDYMGGDLKGVDQYLTYLKSLGVNAVYLNPIFDSASNHGYDTQDYFTIDPYFGTHKDWQNFVKHAKQVGVRIIVDGVFNHLSSDSPFFDRYHRYAEIGACEDVNSPYRDWFTFYPLAGGPCAGPAGPNTMTYNGWFGFENLPVLDKSEPDVQGYFFEDTNSVARYWLMQGASAWRLDVMGDASFPEGYWEGFREAVKSTKPDALIIGEFWQKDRTLLRFLRGDRADTTMNYRLRDAVLGLLAPGPFDSKGFPDSGHNLTPSEFASRLASIREDYPDAAFFSLMNVLDSHDTERILWTLTPGTETLADKEQNAANLAEGKRRQQIASLVQFTLAGAPTIYYGDEAGQTGDDDPDSRRTFPWPDLGGNVDAAMFSHYKKLISLRKQYTVLTAGDLRPLLADDAAGTVAYGRKTRTHAAIVVINRDDQTHLVDVPVAGYIPDGFSLKWTYGVGNVTGDSTTVASGVISVSLNPLSGLLLLTGKVDLTPPAAPSGLLVTAEGDAQISLGWNPRTGAAGYNVYRSPLSGGGRVKVNIAVVTDTSFTDTGLQNGRNYYYVVTALDDKGNESGTSNEVSAMPHYTIGWANLQWPPSMTHTISAVVRTDNAYGQVWIDGATSQPGQTPTLRAQLGFGPEGSDPAGNPLWIWVDAAFNTDAGNNDEFVASMLPETTGTFDYVYRYTTTGGRDWLYADLNGPVPGGAVPSNPGTLTVNSSGDTTAPSVPTGLHVESSSPSGIELAWDALAGDATLYGYEIARGGASGGPYVMLARITGTTFTDSNVIEGATYYYVLRSVDTSFNRSAYTAEVQATAELRTVTVTFNVTVPASTDGTGLSVYIAGTLSRLDGGLPDWNPGGAVLTRVDSTHWTITLTGKETTQIEYTYTLGDWDHVEKDAACGALANRQLTLSYGGSGVQTVNDTVLNWRNVAPCGP